MKRNTKSGTAAAAGGPGFHKGVFPMGHIRAAAGFCGACIAFYIGAGFATMQEIMQYEVSYGSRFTVVLAAAMLIYLYTNLSFATNGSRLKLQRGGEIYRHYCGKTLGAFYDYFSAFFCYMCFIVMCGGANATASQQWGLPNGAGAVILTVLVTATAVLGLNGILTTLSKVGPVVVAAILLIAGITVLRSHGGFAENLRAIDAGMYDLPQVGGGNPLAAGASYGGFVILWFASFLAEIGGKNRLREVNTGILLSLVFIAGASAMCCVALISRVELTAYADIPALVLADAIHPLASQVFALIIFCGTYTASVPLLWTGVGRLAKEGTRRCRLLTVLGGVIACASACFLPYKGLVNVLYGLNGYLGFLLVAFMVVKDLGCLFRGAKERAAGRGESEGLGLKESK